MYGNKSEGGGGRMMTNQEAIKRIKEHIAIHKYRESHAIHIVEALEMAISALEAQEWIPVSKRLPEPYQACIHGANKKDGSCPNGYIKKKEGEIDE
jgi:hypothetical protein